MTDGRRNFEGNPFQSVGFLGSITGIGNFERWIDRDPTINLTKTGMVCDGLIGSISRPGPTGPHFGTLLLTLCHDYCTTASE